MKATVKMIVVTPQELDTVFDRLEAEHVTSLTVVCPNYKNNRLPTDVDNWIDPSRDHQVFRLPSGGRTIS
jgi:hypothetical protein